MIQEDEPGWVSGPFRCCEMMAKETNPPKPPAMRSLLQEGDRDLQLA